MTTKQKIAVETARNMALSPERFPVQNNNTPEQNETIVNTLEAIFEFDENEKVVGFNEDTVTRLNWLASCPAGKGKVL